MGSLVGVRIGTNLVASSVIRLRIMKQEKEKKHKLRKVRKKITATIKENLKLKGSFERWEKLLSENLGMKNVVGKEKGKYPEVGSK